MTNIQRLKLGPETSSIQQGRGAHGRWRATFRRTSGAEGAAVPASLWMIQDSDRLAFAVAEGPAAEVLAERVAEYLWTLDSVNGDWPLNLREWLADLEHWSGVPAGPTGFICGRLERSVAGGRIYLTWLGMNGVRLLDRSEAAITLDTVLSADEGWTPARGPEPVGMALHAYRGSLFGLDRLLVLGSGIAGLADELPDLTNAELEQALDAASEEAGNLIVLDLRVNPVLSQPNSVLLSYRWMSPDTCLLAWHPSPNVTGYRIEEASSPSFDDAELVAELTDGRQVQYRLTPPASRTRYYRVTPLNQGLAGVPSEPVSPTPITLTTPIFEPIQWSADGGYHLHWTPIPQATSYEVQTASEPDVTPQNSEIVYRGETPEVYLNPDTPPYRFYRVRAINVFYAPQTPSPWSTPLRSPTRLDTPTFTRVTQQRLEWAPVPGARQYVVRVSVPGQDETQGEDVATLYSACAVADQPTVYRVRALRRPDDLRTASEWSDPVTVSPPKAGSQRQRAASSLVPLLWVAGIVALLVGLALGALGVQLYQDANATATPTPIPQALINATSAAATQGARDATQVVQLSTAARSTALYLRDQTATAALWTLTPTITLTFTPSITPNLTETVQMAFQAGLTATADEWTATPEPTNTPTPSDTPDFEATMDTAFMAGLTATADEWTATPRPTATPEPTNTPVPSETPDFDATMAAAFVAGLTATADEWTATPEPTNTPEPTETPVPSETPDFEATMAAAFVAGLTATAAEWTATPQPTATPVPSETPDLALTVDAMLTARADEWTPTPEPTETLEPSPTPDWQATIAAHLVAGCFITNLAGVPLELRSGPYPGDRVLLERVPRLAEVQSRVALPDAVWLRVSVTQDGQAIVSGWVAVPSGADERDLYAGLDCPIP